MTNEFFTYKEENSIGFLEINRPDKLNALSEGVLTEFDLILDELSKKKLYGLIFSGAGEKAFIAGADIKAMVSMTPSQACEFSNLGQRVTLKMEGLPYPMIAAVSGFALGGGLEMALGCDFIYCTTKSKFSLPEVTLGLVPGFGGTSRLSKFIGRAKAKEMLYSGEMIGSQKALEYGLVNKIFENKNEALEAAVNYLKTCSNNSPLAISMAKRVLNKSSDQSVQEGLKTEQSVFGELFASKDMAEGTKAFLEKRKANFTGE